MDGQLRWPRSVTVACQESCTVLLRVACSVGKSLLILCRVTLTVSTPTLNAALGAALPQASFNIDTHLPSWFPPPFQALPICPMVYSSLTVHMSQ